MTTKRNNAYLREESLLSLLSLNRFIVPEIQREYVWGNNPDVLRQFLNDLRSKADACPSCHHIHTSKNVNIGFLYSYKPNYVKKSYDRILDEYLIDGQQRMTTIFLLLLYRAAVEDRLSDFLSIIRADDNSNEIAFNYKVRDLTQRFLLDLIEWTKKKGSEAFEFTDNLEDSPSWFLDDYRTDPTVTAMIAAITVIREVFNNDNNYYFDFLLTNIRFWHFKTEATSQGEELYITMNLRGEQLTDNEMKKARMLPQDQLVKHGRDWESWQTFFWLNKDNCVSNPNADRGFNAFLECIEGMENFFYQTKPDIEVIRTYMTALRYVTGNTVEFSKADGQVEQRNLKVTLMQNYSGLYTEWYQKFLTDLWTIINKGEINWHIVNPKDKREPNAQQQYNNAAVARNATMILWSWMVYFRMLGNNMPDDAVLIRLLHFYYIRYHCYKRSTPTISRVIASLNNHYTDNLQVKNDDVESDMDDDNRLFSEEEILMLDLCNNDSKTESLVWQLQDLSYFIDGRGVGGDTIVNYIRKQVETKDSEEKGVLDWTKPAESLTELYDFITKLVPNNSGDNDNIKVKECLLFYKDCNNNPFWQQQSPWYYNNFETSSWKRIVRTPHFRAFYKEFYAFYQMENNSQAKSFNEVLNDFLKQKRKEFFKDQSSLNTDIDNWSYRRLAILYDALLSPESIWDMNHGNIVFKYEEDGSITKYPLFRGTRYVDGTAHVALPIDWLQQIIKKYVSPIHSISNI